jgi:hypothetical protein
MSSVLNVLIACESSGVTREAFKSLGHNAWSCDLEDTEVPGQHYKGDVLEFLNKACIQFDLMIAHPPCDYIANSGQRWMWHPEDSNLPECKRRVNPEYPGRHLDQVKALAFFDQLKSRDEIPYICIENPIPQAIVRRCFGKYDDLIQPWQFGEKATKATCLWLKNLPKLVPTDIVPECDRKPKCHHESPGPMRKINRSRTYPGIAKAWAEQYSKYILDRMTHGR